ncbi:hypothetical protein BDF20DRAFT_123146 [Mycotypha africana]|uniref:uncharacterized protein n=1 Tax=Mycotypha africana TaxID=64632 RepID=UPI0023003C1E|nr:uncharacterized protein BDF20DRAFT_123146 [Mycotypha africana]KAI8970400.1 hypothetical protein BDF20DRAFT_123146 [Mycotypha africana]
MKLFLQQTEVKPRHDRLPTAKLRDTADFSVYYSPKEKTPAAKELPIEQQHLWTLAIALLTPDTEEKQLLSLRKWYSQLVQPGLQYFIERNTKKYPDDPFVSVFAHLVFGQRQKAAELAQQQKDFMLGLYICHSELKDLNYIIEEQFHSLKDQPQQQPSSEKQTSWHHMSVHQKKCWYLIAGQFGYSTTDHFAVTDGLYWQLILGLYIWYGTSYGEPVDLNRDYNKMLEKEAAANAMLELQHMHLGEASSTEPSLPDSGILWYQLLQWWCGDSKIADLQAWPLELLWLLSLYKQPNNIDPLFANLWIEELEKEDFANFAIYASLFLPDAEQKIEHILRNGEWSDEDTLITQYHIPKRLIQKAKALNAHDEWDFEAEYKHLLDGQLLDEAKLALIYFVIPKLFESKFILPAISF